MLFKRQPSQCSSNSRVEELLSTVSLSTFLPSFRSIFYRIGGRNEYTRNNEEETMQGFVETRQLGVVRDPSSSKRKKATVEPHSFSPTFKPYFSSSHITLYQGDA